MIKSDSRFKYVSSKSGDLNLKRKQKALDAGIKPKLKHKGAVAEKRKEMPHVSALKYQFSPKEYRETLKEVPQMKGITEELTEDVPENVGFMSPEGEE